MNNINNQPRRLVNASLKRRNLSSIGDGLEEPMLAEVDEERQLLDELAAVQKKIQEVKRAKEKLVDDNIKWRQQEMALVPKLQEKYVKTKERMVDLESETEEAKAKREKALEHVVMFEPLAEKVTDTDAGTN